MAVNGILLVLYRVLHWINTTILPPWHKWPAVLQLLPITIHRSLLQHDNLIPAPGTEEVDPPLPDRTSRSPNGYGNDPKYPTTGMTGSPFGRNCSPSDRDDRDMPPVQLVAQQLLARPPGKLKPVTGQLNVLAAAWVQTQVHGWVGHYDDLGDKGKVTLDKGSPVDTATNTGCPLKSFNFRRTEPRPNDDSYNSFRSQWWDGSFLYGNATEALKRGRTFKGGQLKVNTDNPGMLPREDGIAILGDNKNSWVGVTLLQELFLREHNMVAAEIAKKHPGLNDQELFDRARLTVTAVNAKIHTLEWSYQITKSDGLSIGTKVNWFGLPHALGLRCKWLPRLLARTQNKETENHGVPYCLTEDFVAVYRLHPLLPDGLPLSSRGASKQDEFIPLSNLVGHKGDQEMMANSDRQTQFWDAALRFPCGALELNNYPVALRNLEPTEDDGSPIQEKIDLAAIDLYRDRERRLPRFNEFRRKMKLKEFKNFSDLTGGDPQATKALEKVYGKGKDGIEKCDLLVGQLAEKKIPNFGLSETGFFIFLLMSTRRLESDPFLNTHYNAKTYSETGLKWIEDTESFRDMLKRHYPEIEKEIPPGISAFQPFDEWPKKFTDGNTYGESKKKV